MVEEKIGQDEYIETRLISQMLRQVFDRRTPEIALRAY